MGWNGKIIGGVLGLMALGPFGAVVGALLGHQFDSATAGGARSGSSATRINELFFPATFRVMGHLAKADGRVSEQEIAAARIIMRSLHLDAVQTRRAIDFHTEGKQPGFDIDRAVRELKSTIWPHPHLAHFFLEIQLHAAVAGNGLGEMPRQRLRRIAAQLGVSAADFAQLEALARWRGGSPQTPGRASSEMQLAEAYKVLEIEAAASDEHVVKAYRRQMSRHHPDKLQAQGVPESMLEHAKERTQQISAAYELIRTRRGMS
jgi:DnaJ like chaperone protein